MSHKLGLSSLSSIKCSSTAANDLLLIPTNPQNRLFIYTCQCIGLRALTKPCHHLFTHHCTGHHWWTLFIVHLCKEGCSYPLLTARTYSFHIINNILHWAKCLYSMYKLLKAHIHTFTFHLPGLSIQRIWAVHWIISLCVLSISLCRLDCCVLLQELINLSQVQT